MEDQRWLREQRQVAYQAMFRADMMQVHASAAVMGKRDGNHALPPELWAVFQAAEREALSAMSLIELCGPSSARLAAGRLQSAGYFLMAEKSSMRGVFSDAPRLGELGHKHKEALEAFRKEARSALGFEDD
nr:hypothetical protein [Streptomyces chartreusis]